VVRRVVSQWLRLLGPVEMGALLAVAPSTVHGVLCHGRLSDLDRIAGERVHRYERRATGSPRHADVNELATLVRRATRRCSAQVKVR
jgi:hypothetical protein